MTTILSFVLGFNPQKSIQWTYSFSFSAGFSKTFFCFFGGNCYELFPLHFLCGQVFVIEEQLIFLSSRLCPFLINIILFLI